MRIRVNPKAEMPFLDHLEELRWRLLWSLLAVIVGFGAGLAAVYYLDVMRFLLSPIEAVFADDRRLIYLAPTDAFFVFLKVSLTLGIVLASPIVVYHAWSFLSPALEKHEKRAIVPALYMGLVLFAAGVALAYFVALPISLRFLMGFLTEVMEPSWTGPAYIGFVVKLLLGFGLVFELPVVVLILSALGLVTPAFLREKRRYAIVAITVVACALSPGDVLSVSLLMMVPLALLYEFSIVLSAVMWRQRKERTKADPEASPPPDDAVASDPYTHGDPARAGDPAPADAPAPDADEPDAPDAPADAPAPDEDPDAPADDPAPDEDSDAPGAEAADDTRDDPTE